MNWSGGARESGKQQQPAKSVTSAHREVDSLSVVLSGVFMDSALLVHRIHFAFTVTFHYLFPQLTMGLAPLIVILEWMGLRRKDEAYLQAARFWAKIFGINFLIGVVTGIPLEFQFGTNWSQFSRYAGGVVGQTLAMEGVFSFF
ncbi:MAG TPA: cytochrome ubiquinol oxidase subunit I, partial [Candidatus Acidoferrum sp.]|nr:cytochrome ubiquinol oxidase subunit I [Candidatus Acidoferrum sp.]